MSLSRKFTANIQGSECMGTSLNEKINPSFNNLDTAAQLLSTNLATLSTTTFAISGSVISGFNSLRTSSITNTSLITGLSSYVLPRITKAWVNFDGTPQSIVIQGSATVSSSFNVLSVARVTAGRYRVQFDPWFIDNKYAVTSTAGTSGVYTFTLNPSPSTVEVYSSTFTTQPTAVDSIVSVVVNSY